jgi:tetratricopeptide (TPR) repeat protein
MLDTYGWALHHAGRNEEALQYLLNAYERHPTMYCIHYHLGVVYLALSRPEKAREHLERQVRMTGTREAAMATRVLAALPSPRPAAP